MSTRNTVILTGFLVALAAIYSSCRREPDLTGYPEVKFATEVQPIIAANCTQSGCHNNVDGEEFSLVNYDAIMGYVTPYKAYKSDMYKSIVGKAERMMPPSGPLTDDQIRTIFVWIEQGAPNN
jgi:hypothetical protein